MCGRKKSESRTISPEHGPDLGHKDLGNLERCEVSTLVVTLPTDDVGVAVGDPFSDRRGNLFREHGEARGDRDDVSRALPEALPVQPCRRRAVAVDPVQHDVVEHLVAVEHVFGMPVVVSPRPELLDDPGGLRRR